MRNRTKIVCTVGPSSASPSILEKLMRAGMDVARLNFSHATSTDHQRLIRSIRRAAKRARKLVPIIGDLQGSKIRLGELPSDGVELSKGSMVRLTTAHAYVPGQLPVAYRNLLQDVKKGSRIFIDEAAIELRVERVSGRSMQARVVIGGKVLSHKGINFPDSIIQISSMTLKDRQDALFGIKQGVEWFALSYATKPEHVVALKRFIHKHTPQGTTPARVMVKIEKREAVDSFEEILSVADAVMIARGDLGLEIKPQEIPVLQKEMIEKCRQAGTPVVVATQMLDSMIHHPRPTRAEVSDVANAVFDHTDAVMLSGESAMGRYPLQAVKTMAEIVREAERSKYDDVLVSGPSIFGDAIDGVLASHALAPWSESVLRSHPEIPLFLATKSDREARQLMIRWGVVTFVMKNQNKKTFVRLALARLKRDKLVKHGMRLAVVLSQQHEDGFDLVSVK